MNNYDIQSLVYICLGIDFKIRALRGKQIANIIHQGGYEIGVGCPGGMMETTWWAMTDAFPTLKKVAEDSHVEMIGTPWLYEVCEVFGHAIVNYVKETGLWPDDGALVSLAKKSVNKVHWF